MGYTRTLGQLTGTVRDRGDYPEVEADTDYISGPFLIGSGASAYKEAYELVADADPDRLTTTAETTLSSATGSFALPTDLYRLRGIDVRVGDRWVPMSREDRSNTLSSDSESVGGTPDRYRLQGDLVIVWPRGSSGTRFRTTYIPEPDTLDGPDDALDGVGGADELMVALMLRDCREREGLDTSSTEMRIERETARVRRMARSRDLGQPPRVEDPLRGAWGMSRRRRRR